MNPSFVSGALFMGSLVAGLFFLKFFTRSREGLFLWFSLGFGLMAIERVIIGNTAQGAGDFSSSIYLFRLCAFLCIAGGIVAKNRRTPPASEGAPPAPPHAAPGSRGSQSNPNRPISSVSHT